MLYTKTINDRQIFSDCKSIRLDYDHPPLERGQWVSNPDSQLIYDEGWREYVPPVVPPVPRTEPEMGELLEAVKRMLATDASELSDEDALAVAALYPTWASKIGEQVAVGTRLWDDGKLWKVIQSHTVQEDWRPADAVSLFVEVSIEEWPEWVQPTGAQDAYNTGDRVSHNGSHWESTIDGNVWEPGVTGWVEL